MTGWMDQVQRRARVLHKQIAEIHRQSESFDIDPTDSLESVYKLLDEIYSHDLPLAHARDNSDLLLHVEGKAVIESPRISFVSFLFNSVKAQVRDLSKAVAGIRDEVRVTSRDIDLGLGGLAPGSLYIGFNVPEPSALDGQQNLLGDQDPVYKATKEALRLIGIASKLADETSEAELNEEAHEAFDDPLIRDATMVAMKQLSPSGRRGVDSIGVSGSGGAGILTSESRRKFRNALKSPVLSEEHLELIGKVREIDLDARRFELRRISSTRQIEDIRVIYEPSIVGDVKRLLDAEVSIYGLVERKANEAPRLMSLEDIRILKLPSE